jgi:elongation factor Ts
MKKQEKKPMPEISASLVKELREKTGAGMMDCKKALSETSGNLEKAIEHLRKQGIASASKKSGRIASEGLVDVAIQDGWAAMVEVNCETDFVAKTPDFQKFVQQITQHILRQKPKILEELLKQHLEETNETIEFTTKEKIAKIGENISIRRFVLIGSEPGEMFGSYIHMGNKIGGLVKISTQSPKVTPDVTKEIAMHIAASVPRFVRRHDIPEDEKAKEREIYRSQLQESGKPKEILDKIIEGKLAKFASEVCLEEQVFIKDPTGKKSVLKHLQEFDPQIQIKTFVRYQVGEGLSKREENFAEEVAKQIQK